MVRTPPPCPPEARLQHFLDGQLDEGEVDALDTHIETCRNCQTTLARLTTDLTLVALRNWSPNELDRFPRLQAQRHIPPARPPIRATSTLPAVPGYEVVRELGRGGAGVVYLARDTQLGRPAAVKVLLHGPHAGPDQLARFKTEALAVARLGDPGVVQVYQVGEAGGLPFCAMEYVPGGNLRQRLAAGSLPVREAAELVERLARTMHAVHAAGFVHRDLKPENVLLGADGTPKVADFGLVLRLPTDGSADTPRLTATGEMMGTPCYMAPEQVAGHGSRVGPATDVYALGVILYELLTSRPPFPAGAATFSQVLTHEPVGPRRLVPELPRDLETVCLKCLRKESADRYASALALADDLRRFLDGRPVLARPIGPIQRVWRWACRNPPLAALLGTVGVLVMALAVGGPVMAYQQSRLADALEREKTALIEANAREQAAAAEAKASASLSRQTADGLLAAVGSDLLFVTDIPAFKGRALKVALAVYEQYLRTAADDPDARLGSALAQLRVGTLHLEAGAVPAGVAALRDGVDRLRATAGERPADPALRRTLALGRFRLGLALDRHHQELAAREEIDRATALLRTLPLDPQAQEARVDRAKEIWLQGHALLSEGRSLAAAEGVFRAALDEVAPLAAESSLPEARRVLGRVQTDLGVVRNAQRDPADCEAWFRRGLSTLAGLVTDFPDDLLYREELGRVRTQLAHSIIDRPAEALPLLKQSVAAWASLSDGPWDRRFAPEESKTRLLLGMVFRRLGRPAEAEPEYRATARLLKHLLEDEPLNNVYPVDYAVCIVELAVVRAEADGPQAGLEVLDPIARTFAPYFLDIRQVKKVNESPIVGFAILRGDCLAALGRHAEADEEWKRAESHPHVINKSTVQARRSLVRARMKDWKSALSLVEAAAKDEKLPADAVVDLARTYALAAAASGDDGQAVRALDFLKRADKSGAFKDVGAAETLARDPNFSKLVRRDDFKRFLGTLKPPGPTGQPDANRK